MEEKTINKRTEKYYNYIAKLSPDEWEESPDWDDITDELNLLFDNKLENKDNM